MHFNRNNPNNPNNNFMKKTTIIANRLMTYFESFIKDDKVDLKANHRQIISLFNASNFIRTSPQDRIALLKMVTVSVRAELDKELQLAEENAQEIKLFKKEPYISAHKQIEKRNYDFLAMHNIEFIREN